MRKSIKALEKQALKKLEREKMIEFFLDIWKKVPHICTNCKINLGKEPKTYFFDHVLEKSKYPELMLQEDNIMILCLECHGTKTNGKLSKVMLDKKNELLTKYNL